MKTLKPLAVAAALAALPLGAFAAESTLSYNFIEGGYAKATQRDGDSNDFDYDGFYGAVSGKVAKNVYLFGDYRQLTSDTFAGARVRTNSALAGIGLIIPVTKVVDLNVNGGGVWQKYKYEGTAANFTPHDNDDTGFFVGGGARAQILPLLEVNGGFRYSKVFDNSETTGLVGAVFSITPALAVTGNYEFGDHFNQYQIGGRFNFGL